MAILELALPTVFLHEGRYVDHPADPGGKTNWGISLRFLKSTGDLDDDGWIDGDINHDGIVNDDDIKKMTQAQAAELYEIYFWSKNRYDRIEDQIAATKIFDLSINMGSKMANTICQRAVRAALRTAIDEDGVLGFKSLVAINMCDPIKLAVAIKSEAAGFYRQLAHQNPKFRENFLTGWLNRAYSDCVTERK